MRAIDRRSVDIASTAYAVTSAMFCVVALDAQRFEVHQIEAPVWRTFQRNAMMYVR